MRGDARCARGAGAAWEAYELASCPRIWYEVAGRVSVDNGQPYIWLWSHETELESLRNRTEFVNLKLCSFSTLCSILLGTQGKTESILCFYMLA